VNQTERWIGQARDLLKECTHTKKLSSLGTLQDHFRRLDLPEALKDLGCSLQCAGCSWGIPQPHPLQTPCRLVAMQEALLGIDPSDKNSASLLRDASELLAALDRSPKPERE
jgi:hypothetical protein